MAVPEYRPIFKTKPTFTGGLAALLQGFNQGTQNSFENRMLGRQVDWKDPNRPISEPEMERMMMENYQKGLASQLAYAPMTGSQSMTFPQFKALVASGQAAMNGGNAGFDPMTGQPNPVNPVQQIQGLPGASIPPGPAQPAAPVAVDRKARIGELIEELYQARKAQGG
jgi:hypothetical protein